MSPALLFGVLLIYFVVLLAVAHLTGRHASNNAYYIGNKNSHWLLVAFGMVGTTLSGVTFVSVPGAVGRDGFGYVQVMSGYVLGYLAVAFILLPLYYRFKLTSIYHYLEVRLGHSAGRTGAVFFLLSRLLGASARLYLVVNILHAVVLDQLGVPFWISSAVILAMIVLYTYEGGVKTIVWTDTLQTACMLGGLVVCVVALLQHLDLSLAASLAQIEQRGLARVWTMDVNSPAYFLKQVLAGAFITLTMTGMDQESMQKTISVKTLGGAQKNIVLLTVVLTGVLCLFLLLGGLLQLAAPGPGGDRQFPQVVMAQLPAEVQLVFMVALVSALFPSADGAITALTSSFCIDLLGLSRRHDLNEAAKVRWRRRVHLGFALAFLLLVLGFKWLDNPSMIVLVLKLAGYTYGPLLGLFAFGILTRRSLRQRWVGVVALAGPLLCAAIDLNQAQLLGHYRIGLELLIINGLFVFVGLLAISRPANTLQ
jgi:Na+/proline symporter